MKRISCVAVYGNETIEKNMWKWFSMRVNKKSNRSKILRYDLLLFYYTVFECRSPTWNVKCRDYFWYFSNCCTNVCICLSNSLACSASVWFWRLRTSTSFALSETDALLSDNWLIFSIIVLLE